MQNISKKIDEVKAKGISSEPVILNLKNEAHAKQLQDFLDDGSVCVISDDYVEQLKELFAVKNPTLVYQPGFEDKFKEFLSQQENERPLFTQGNWVFYPWLSSLVHILEDSDFQLVRTARNRNL